MSKVRFFGHTLLWCATVSLALLAVILVVARLLIVQVPMYKYEVEQYLSEALGVDLTIGRMAARMQAFRPVLSLTDISLKAEHETLLGATEIRVAFEPLGLLLGRVAPNKIVIVNTAVSIKRFADGHISILGLPSDNQTQTTATDFSWLLSGRYELINSQINWQDSLRELPDLALTQAHISFQNNGDTHLLSMKAKLPDALGDTVKFSLRLKGNPLLGNAWSADSYLKLKEVNASNYASRLNIPQLSLTRGVGDIELWSDWDASQLTKIKGIVDITDVGLSRLGETVDIQQLSGEFEWVLRDKGWQLWGKDFLLSTKNLAQEATSFNVNYQQDTADSYQLNGFFNRLNLEALSGVLQASELLTDKQTKQLNQAKLSGQLDNGSFAIRQGTNDLFWAACSQFNQLSVQAVERTPALNNFTGDACSTQKGGWLNLRTDGASVEFKQLFRQPLKINELTSQLSWLKNDDGWAIHSDQVALNVGGVKTSSRLQLQLFPANKKPWMNIQTQFSKVNVEDVPQYLPVGIMPARVVKWLDEAFISGGVSGGGFLFRGDVADFPFRQHEGVFQVLFNTEETTLHYADHWPDAMGVSANVEFKNEGLSVVAEKGHVAGNQLEHVAVNAEDLGRGQSLTISGQLTDDISGLYRFFEGSPLHKLTSGLTDHTKVSGQVSVDLNIDIPLRKKRAVKVTADAILNNNRLNFPGLGIAVTNINGRLAYGETGLKANSIKAEALGEELTININHEGGHQVIKAMGDINIAGLSKKYPSAMWKHAAGHSAGLLTVRLPKQGGASGNHLALSLDSNLKGISINLPDPMAKKAGSKIVSRLDAKLDSTSLLLNIKHGDILNGIVQFKGDRPASQLRLDKADIHLGQSMAELSQGKAIQLSGRIQTLNVEAWQQALKKSALSTSSNGLVNKLNLNIGHLKVLNKDFKRIHLMGEYDHSAWSGQVTSPTVSGHYYLPDDLTSNQTVVLELDSLVLTKQQGININGGDSPLSAERIPNIDLTSQSLTIGEANLGQLTLKLRHKKKGLIIEDLSLLSEQHKLQAKGAWDVKEGVNRSGLQGQFSSQSLGQLLQTTGLATKLKGTPADMYFDLHWPGEPHKFSKKQLNGYVKIKAKEGRLLDVEPGIGRIFGLLSLSSIQRRLQLNFSDLFQKGLSFDEVNGEFLILNGDVSIDNLSLESPAAYVGFEGELNLAKETIDQLVTVIPKTTETLPLAGALIGGPLVGAATYLVQKIAGKTLNKFAGYQYHVTGTWADADIKQLSKPGDKVFGFVNDILTPVFNPQKEDVQ